MVIFYEVLLLSYEVSLIRADRSKTYYTGLSIWKFKHKKVNKADIKFKRKTTALVNLYPEETIEINTYESKIIPSPICAIHPIMNEIINIVSQKKKKFSI